MDEQTQRSLFMDPAKVDLTPAKSIRIAVSDDVLITEIERRIIDTAAFQRLRRIKQLGTSYLIYPSATHSRFEHSLGTLKMADLMVQKINEAAKIQKSKYPNRQATFVDDSCRQIIRLAALLHDVTQVPYGHTLEDETHIFADDHDNDDKRFNYFLGKESIIGRILLNVLGIEGYDFLIKILTARKKKIREGDVLIEDLGEYAFICDIVKNTVCADLLDYLDRDSYFCGLNLNYGKRFLNFLILAPYKNPDTSKESIRLAIRIWKEKDKTHRRDIIDELINLLNCRFYLGSAVYFHHAKLITSAMISRAVQQALSSKIIKIEELWDMGDDELLNVLAKNSHDALARNLANGLLNRNFYNDFYEITREEVKAVADVNLLEVLQQNFNKNKEYRRQQEDRLSNIIDQGENGDVLIYCPDIKMSMKEAEMMILWKGDIIPFYKIEDKLYKDKIESIIDSHKKLWSLKIFISAKLAGRLQEDKYSSILESWCRHLVFSGSDREEQLLKNAINNIIFDILQTKGKVDKKLIQTVFAEVASSAAQSKPHFDSLSRSNIESIIESCMAPPKKK